MFIHFLLQKKTEDCRFWTILKLFVKSKAKTAHYFKTQMNSTKVMNSTEVITLITNMVFNKRRNTVVKKSQKWKGDGMGDWIKSERSQKDQKGAEGRGEEKTVGTAALIDLKKPWKHIIYFTSRNSHPTSPQIRATFLAVVTFFISKCQLMYFFWKKNKIK